MPERFMQPILRNPHVRRRDEGPASDGTFGGPPLRAEAQTLSLTAGAGFCGTAAAALAGGVALAGRYP